MFIAAAPADSTCSTSGMKCRALILVPTAISSGVRVAQA
jgi:hypothetical protein